MYRIRFLQSLGQRNPSLKDCLLKPPRSLQARPSQSFVQISYTALKDKLLRLGSVSERVQGQWDSFKSKRKKETKSTKHMVSVSKQMTPVIIEMIERQSSLKSMLYVTAKLLPKMTLADKIKVQDIATNKLYSEIADESVVFHKGKYCSTIYHRLYIEGTLSDSVKPLSQAQTFNHLIDEIAASVDHMERLQILNVFLNLQFLDWPKESHPVIILFEKVQSLNFSTLNLQEFLLYTEAVSIYKPTTYRRQTQALMFHWFDQREVTFSGDMIEAINRLKRISHRQMNKSQNTVSDFKRKVFSDIFENKLHQEVVQSLSFENLCSLILVLNHTTFFKTTTEEYIQVLLEQIRKKLGDVTVKDLNCICKLPKKYLSKLKENEGFQCVTQKCLHVLSQEQPLKFNDLGNILILLSKTCDDENELLQSLDFQKHQLNLVEKIDVSGLLIYSINMPVHGRVDVLTKIQNRIKKYVMKGLFDRIVDYPYQHRNIFLFGFRNNRIRNDVALEVRDKFIETITKTDRFNKSLHLMALEMCMLKLDMTPTSLEFLENANLRFIDNIFTLANFTKYVHAGYRSDLSEAMFYRYNNAMSMLLSTFVEKYALYASIWLGENYFVFGMDPIIQIIVTEKIGWICNQENVCPKILLKAYYCSLSNPRQVLEKLLNNSDIVHKTASIALYQLLTDNFFNECGKVSDVQQSLALVNLKRKYLPDLEMNRRPHYMVSAPKDVKKWIMRAFKEQVGRTFIRENNISCDLMMLTNKDNEIVKFTKENEKNADRLGLQKVAIFYRGPKTNYNVIADIKKTVYIPLLQKSGIKCVVIWHHEWFSLANRTYDEKVKLVQSKVESQSMTNTAPTFSYDLAKVKQGPYKDYFMNMNWSLDRIKPDREQSM